MLSFRTSVRPEEVRFHSQHVLFVEGKDGNSVDPRVLSELFDNGLRIEPLGPSFSVKSVAEALYSHHPSYYFLVDRDHQDDTFIQNCWDNFPDPATHNLLVWKRREIENYFLEPEYLFNSKYCQVSKEQLGNKILEFTNARLFLDAANHVIIAVREELKRNWIQKFSNPLEFSTRDNALNKLKLANAFEQHVADVTGKVSEVEIENRYNQCLDLMLGGEEGIAFGTGRWLSMIQGKKVLSQVINSGCFRVVATDGNQLNGKDKLNAIIKDLMKKDEHVLPDDFKELRELIAHRLSGV